MKIQLEVSKSIYFPDKGLIFPPEMDTVFNNIDSVCGWNLLIFCGSRAVNNTIDQLGNGIVNILWIKYEGISILNTSRTNHVSSKSLNNNKHSFLVPCTMNTV